MDNEADIRADERRKVLDEAIRIIWEEFDPSQTGIWREAAERADAVLSAMKG